MPRRAAPAHRHDAVDEAAKLVPGTVAEGSEIRYQADEPEHRGDRGVSGNREDVPHQRAAKLRLDANGAWDRRRAERWLERCVERPVEFIEQPIAADAKGAEDLLLGLAGDFPTPLALDESVVSGADVTRWLDLGWPGVFVLKPSLLGDAAAVVARLEKAKASVVFSSALETAIGAKAALRLAFAFGSGSRALGCGVLPLFQDQRFDGPYLTPFIRPQDVATIDEEAVWNALS